MAAVTIYIKSWCPYSVAAMDLLSRKGVEFETIDIEQQNGTRQEMITKAGGRSTVPQVFIGDRHIGGYDDLSALDRAGKLDPLLAA